MPHLAERFANAVRTLVSDGTVKQRLSQAYSEHLDGVEEMELPTSLRGSFSCLQAALTRIAPVGNEGRVRANVQKMSPAEAGNHASTIVKLYVEIVAHGERAEPLKVVTSTQKTTRYLNDRPVR